MATHLGRANLGKAKMEYGGWKELLRRLKRFHVIVLPVIRQLTYIVMLTSGFIFLAIAIDKMEELELSAASITFFFYIFVFVLIYWSFRMLFK